MSKSSSSSLLDACLYQLCWLGWRRLFSLLRRGFARHDNGRSLNWWLLHEIEAGSRLQRSLATSFSLPLIHCRTVAHYEYGLRFLAWWLRRLIWWSEVTRLHQVVHVGHRRCRQFILWLTVCLLLELVCVAFGVRTLVLYRVDRWLSQGALYFASLGRALIRIG